MQWDSFEVQTKDQLVGPLKLNTLIEFKTRLLLMTLLCVIGGCVSSHQAKRAAYSLVGTWSAKAAETTDSAGRTIASDPATGLIVYTPEGRMAVQIMVLPRPVVPAAPEGPGHVDAWDSAQVRKVIETYDAYFGTYDVDEVNHTVTHHVQGELRPNLDGSTFRRHYQVNGDRLTLSSTDPRETWRVVWERVK